MVTRRAFATLAAVSLLVLALTLLTSAVLLAEQTQNDHRRAEADVLARSAIWKQIGTLLTALQAWNSDELTFDAWWAQNSAAFVPTSLVSLSARLNLNTLTPFLLSDSDLKTALLVSADQFVTYRSTKGPRADLSDYAAMFTPASMANWFCSDSRFNVNTADEIVLERIIATRTGSEAVGAAMRQSLRNFRQNRQPLTNSDWQTLAGSDLASLDGLLTTDPELDVNEIPADLLRILLKDPDFALDQPDAKAQTLIVGRAQKPWTPEILREVLGVDKKSPLLQYLGTRTSFVEAHVVQDALAMRFVIALSYSQDSPPRIAARILVNQDIR